MDITKTNLTININNITMPQSLAIQDLLATWQNLGILTTSKWTSFYADGGADFNPIIKINGNPIEYVPLDIISEEKRQLMWTNDEYRIIYDDIAWRMQGDYKNTAENNK